MKRLLAAAVLPALVTSLTVSRAQAPSVGHLRANADGKPNIIFILADDLGYGDLGCYGQKKIKTPNIDRLAEEGMRFTQCYAGSTVCAPSRCCLMTGVHTGTTSDHVWAFWDLLPTAAELAGVKPPKGIDGISMVPTLLGMKQSSQHEFLYWEFHERGFQQAARMGDWKAVKLAANKPPELYNLVSDPGETENIADKHPGIVAKIEEFLKKARTDSKDWPTSQEAGHP